ncbi:MAG: nickel-dependent lactate racemase, partial [Lentisphaeria bacterium]|nr:nickel-dependent lactate racemase [Lentisphaeria bacterium]
MLVKIPYGNGQMEIRVPDDTALYGTSYEEPEADAREIVLGAVRKPIGCAPLSEALRQSDAQSVVVVVSDITRPIPYADFLDVVLKEMEDAAVQRDDITILIATGMHRPSTVAEREHMFGPEVCRHYRILDHQAGKTEELVEIDGTSWSGRKMELNRHFVEADFRVTTGLVEPHFMAGFSGGRKSVCPGLCSLETVKSFHSFSFLDHPAARGGNLVENPLHAEALSIARQAKVDFCINLVVGGTHRIVDAVAGELEASHEATCQLVAQQACPLVKQEVDVLLTSSGGYPLDATFYQCVKGMASCLPAVRKGGVVISVGSCSEGIGG